MNTIKKVEIRKMITEKCLKEAEKLWPSGYRHQSRATGPTAAMQHNKAAPKSIAPERDLVAGRLAGTACFFQP